MAVDAFDRLKENLQDVARLMEIHQGEAGPLPGRKYDVEVLNKSGVVLALACWEAFVEDCATQGFEHLVSHVPTPDALPETVRRLVAKRIKADPNDMSPWRLASDAWKLELQGYHTEIFRRFVAPLNTPSARKVDELFDALLGMKNLSAHWRWHKMSAKELSDRLDRFIHLRGGIAHRNDPNRSVTKFDVTSNADTVERIAGITSNRARDHLFSITGVYPWPAKTEPPKPGRHKSSN